MKPSLLPLAALLAGALGVERSLPTVLEREPHRPERARPERLHLKEEAMTLHFTASKQEATLVVEAEAETALARVTVQAPDGREVLRMHAGDGPRFALQGFLIETRETDPERLLGTYPEGRYAMEAWTTDGRVVRGSAELVHDLLDEPALVYPYPGAVNVPTNLTVGWVPDPRAERYQVSLEQNENDGLVVELPGDSSSLVIPPGVLAPGTYSHVEVGAIGPNGNCTLSEVFFTTR